MIVQKKVFPSKMTKKQYKMINKALLVHARIKTIKDNPPFFSERGKYVLKHMANLRFRFNVFFRRCHLIAKIHTKWQIKERVCFIFFTHLNRLQFLMVVQLLTTPNFYCYTTTVKIGFASIRLKSVLKIIC